MPEGQFLLPMVELITEVEMAVDRLIDVTGRATIEVVLTLSAQEVAGPQASWQGRRRDHLVWPPEGHHPPGRTQASGRGTASATQGQRRRQGNVDPGIRGYA